MDIVIIERKTFDLLLESVKALTRKVDFLLEKSKDRSLRDKDLLPCTQIGRKFYYKPADVENFILHGAGTIEGDCV